MAGDAPQKAISYSSNFKNFKSTERYLWTCVSWGMCSLAWRYKQEHTKGRRGVDDINWGPNPKPTLIPTSS